MNYALRYPKFWLSYFAMSVLILTGDVIAATISSAKGANLLGVVYGLVGLFPLYGYMRQLRFNPRWLWQCLHAIAVVSLVACILICLFIGITQAAAAPIVIGVPLLLLGGPYVFALQQYVYRSPHLWV